MSGKRRSGPAYAAADVQTFQALLREAIIGEKVGAPLALRPDPVVSEVARAHPEQRVRFGQRGINAQRVFYRHACQWHHFMRRCEAQVRQSRVAGAQQAVRKRELRIERDGVVEQGFCPLERSLHRCVPEISSLR